MQLAIICTNNSTKTVSCPVEPQKRSHFHLQLTENDFFLRNTGCLKYFHPLRNSIPALCCIKCGWLRCLSELFVRCCLHLPNTPSPTSPSKHHFCRSSSVCLLQSRQSSPLSTPHFPWKATLSHCSATWPAPTVPTRRATGWRTGRKSQKHVPQIGTPNTGRSHSKTLCNLCVCECAKHRV